MNYYQFFVHLPIVPEDKAIGDSDIRLLGLSRRTMKGCVKAIAGKGKKFSEWVNAPVAVSQIIALSADEILETKNFGKVMLNELRGKLADHGLKLKGER